MIFKLYNCDLGIKIGGVNYEFNHVDSITIEDPERNKLTRGGNGKNKVGLTYREGIKEPKRWTIPILSMSAELKGVLDDAFDDQTRMEVYCIDRTDGSSKMAKNAILSNRPRQLTIDETPESMQVSLEFETFDSSEVHKLMVTVSELKGFKSLKALNAYHSLLLGLKMLPSYMALDYETFLQSIEAMSESDQEKMIREAILFVELQKDEVEAMLSFCKDKNGVPYSAENIKNLSPSDLVEHIVAVSMQIAGMKINFVSEKEKKT